MSKRGSGKAKEDDAEGANGPEEIVSARSGAVIEPEMHSLDIMASPPAAETVTETDSVDRDAGELQEKRSDIEDTRSDLSTTVDAIQEKLSPAHLAQQAKEVVRDATVEKVRDVAGSVTDTAQGVVSRPGGTATQAGSAFVESIKQNPVPAALIGLGLGWLVIRARHATTGQPQGRLPYEREERPTGSLEQNDPANQEGVSTDAGQVQKAVSDTVGQAQGTVGNAVGQVQESAAQAAARAQSAADRVLGQAQDHMSQISNRAQSSAQQAARRSQTMLQENPFVVGAAAMALGLAAGLAVPGTAKEDQMMGETRDSVVETAQQGMQETMEKARAVAQEALDVAKQGAERKG